MMLKSLNIVALLVWAIFLAWLFTYGKSDLVRLIHPRLWWVLGSAIVVLALYLGSLITPYSIPTPNKTLITELPSILILLVPVLYFSIAREARLDGTSLHNKIIQTDRGIFLNTLPPFGIFDDESTADMSFSLIIRQPEKYQNKEVEIVCQSFVSDKIPENMAMCYRYFITCCAADALPVFVFLKNRNELEIESDRWIKVHGPLSLFYNNNMEFISIDTKTIEYVEEPSFPWAL